MKHIVLIVLLLCQVSLFAQNGELRVDSFYCANGIDFSARGASKRAIPENPDISQALIKIMLPLEGVEIKQMRGIISIENYDDKGEFWVWTYPGENQPNLIQINHRDYHPLYIKLADYDIITEGMSTYHVIVSVPSSAITDADWFYYNLDFEQALTRYQNIVNDENCSKTEKDIARERCKILQENNSAVMKLNNWASTQFNNYLSNESVKGRKEKIKTLVKMRDVYDDLYNRTSINMIQNRIEKIEEELNNLISSAMIKGRIIISVKKGTGIYEQKAPTEKISLYWKGNTREDQYNLLMDLKTDLKGYFNCQINGGIGYKLKFVYKDDKGVYSAERTLTFGEDYEVNGNFGNIILTK